MPIEIRESIIRLNLLDSSPQGRKDSNGTEQKATSLLVKECVDAVLQILKEREER